MGKRLNKQKALRKEVIEKIEELEDIVAELSEENSRLRLLMEQRDKDLITYINESLKNEATLRRGRDNELRIELADLGTKLDKAGLTFIGKKIFK